MPRRPFRATFRRSWRLFQAFGVEQTEPDVFYGTLAEDSVAQVRQYMELSGARVLDVGGGPGYFASTFESEGARYTPLDADLGELSGLGDPLPGTVLGSGMALPFRDGSFDVAFSSNVLEHVDRPWLMAEEMVRVTARGGLVFISYTVWFGPWGGHETSPWHLLLGGHGAADRYARRLGHRPKNDYGHTLFKVTVADGLRWAGERARRDDVELVDVVPRYLPRTTYWLLRVPVLREFVTWNLALVLRRR